MQLARFERTGAMNDPDMILRIRRNTDRLAHDPVIRERLRPQRIHFKTRCDDTGGFDHRMSFEQNRRDPQHSGERYQARTHVKIALHAAPSLPEFSGFENYSLISGMREAYQIYSTPKASSTLPGRVPVTP